MEYDTIISEEEFLELEQKIISSNQSIMDLMRKHFDEFERVMKIYARGAKNKKNEETAYEYIQRKLEHKGFTIQKTYIKDCMVRIRKERGLSKKTKTKPVPMKQAIQTTSNQTIKREVVEPKQVVKTFNPEMHITSPLHVFPEWLPLGIKLQDKSIDEIRSAWKDKYWENSSVKSKKQYGDKAMWNVCEGMPNALLVESIMQSPLGMIEITQQLADFLLYLEYKLPGILSTETPKSVPSVVERLKDNEYPFADIVETDYNKNEKVLTIYSRYIKHLNSIKAAVERNEYVPNEKGQNVWTG